jgi:hypothetical protein
LLLLLKLLKLLLLRVLLLHQLLLLRGRRLLGAFSIALLPRHAWYKGEMI